jgi:iron(III) transport system permease protein
MTVIAVPLGAVLAFVMERTDFPGKRFIEPMLLVPSFVSPMVLSFGYVVAAGPVGFYSIWATELFGAAPWGLYSLAAMSVIAGLTHVPNVYIYASSALKNLGSDVEEAARIAVSRRRLGEPAADHAGAALFRSADLLSRPRALRAAARPR